MLFLVNCIYIKHNRKIAGNHRSSPFSAATPPSTRLLPLYSHSAAFLQLQPNGEIVYPEILMIFPCYIYFPLSKNRTLFKTVKLIYHYKIVKLLYHLVNIPYPKKCNLPATLPTTTHHHSISANIYLVWTLDQLQAQS